MNFVKMCKTVKCTRGTPTVGQTVLANFDRINQPDAANSQTYYLSFKYSSTGFGHPHAHHQELQQLQ
jgi:hypothetical protein